MSLIKEEIADVAIYLVRLADKLYLDIEKAGAERVSEESEKYPSTTRYTQYIESSLGIKSCSELAPHLAKAVERPIG